MAHPRTTAPAQWNAGIGNILQEPSGAVGAGRDAAVDIGLLARCDQ